MRRNASYTNVSGGSKIQETQNVQPEYQRYIYINQQNNRKDNSTIFHSPYKNGKKNADYYNPTFMSSDIFYPKHYLETSHTPKKCITPNRNDVKKKQLYEERIMRKSNQRQTHSRTPEASDPSPAGRRIRQDLYAVRMRKELKSIQQYTNQGSPPTRSISRNLSSNQLPVYLIRQAPSINNQLKETLQKHLREALLLKEKRLRAQKQQKQRQRLAIQREEQRFKAQVVSSKQFEKQRATLLRELLLNQQKR